MSKEQDSANEDAASKAGATEQACSEQPPPSNAGAERWDQNDNIVYVTKDGKQEQVEQVGIAWDSFHAACFKDAHNSALAAEQERYEKLERSVLDLSHPNLKLLLKDLDAEREKIGNWRKVVEDDCETEEQVKELARPIIGDFKVDGDSYGVPNEADIVESLIESFRAQLQAKERELKSTEAKLLHNFDVALQLKRDFAAAQAAMKKFKVN